MAPSQHSAVAAHSRGADLELISVTAPAVTGDNIKVHVQWTASTPADMHFVDGALLHIPFPIVPGSGFVGTVVETGPEVKTVKVSDRVFGFGFKTNDQRPHQDFIVLTEYLVGKVPEGIKSEDAVTVPDNFVTGLHVITKDLELELPWPVPAGYVPEHANDAILVWGGSSSAGQFTIEILKHYGYRNIITTASAQHHESLKKKGATYTFDYRNADVFDRIKAAVGAAKAAGQPRIPYIIDCIGSQEGSVKPVAQLAEKGAIAAVLLPIVVKDHDGKNPEELGMSAQDAAPWAEGVIVRGVRTHFYMENPWLKEHAQPTIMPAMLASGAVTANKPRFVEGKTLLERAQKAMGMLRRKEASGERLVWRVSDLEL